MTFGTIALAVGRFKRGLGHRSAVGSLLSPKPALAAHDKTHVDGDSATVSGGGGARGYRFRQ